MPQLNLAVTDDLAKNVRAYADAYGISMAAAVRVLLRTALKAEQEKDNDKST